jgi:ABC-type multidrug transport system ATPase subunit
LNWDGNTLWLTDLGSTNGTQLEGQPLSPRRRVKLPWDTSFTIGPFTLSVTQGSEAAHIPEEKKPGSVLRYQLKGGEWDEYPLTPGEHVLGRQATCDLILDYQGVSRQHARLRVSTDGFWLTDLGSTNGTFLDGRPLPIRKEVRLLPGQEFTISEFTLSVEGPPLPAQQVFALEERPISAVLESLVTFSMGPMQTMLAEPGAILQGPERILDLSRSDRVSIGREADNDIQLNHPQVSSYHAIIERMGTRFRIKDLRSTNGVFVNHKRVDGEAFLSDWDEVSIGPYTFILSGDNLQIQPDLGLLIHAWRLHQYVSPEINLLKDISLLVKPMEFVALVGMSGAGKTTLLNAISGYWPATHGRVSVSGVDLYQNYDAFRNEIGYVPQQDIVHMELTPETALDFAARLRMPQDTSPAERAARVREVLTELDLFERKDVPIFKLSGGQLKRVSIGVELITKPRLFFLDEPTSGLDPGTEYDMMKLLRKLADQGRTVVLITHATKNVMLCDKVIFLARGGYMAFYGPPEEALVYFDQYRLDRERREKMMEFDDIYRILNDESRGTPEEWDRRYRASTAYQQYVATVPSYTRPQPTEPGRTEPAQTQPVTFQRGRVSGWRQFFILSARNLKILFQDKVSLGLMLALAPGLGTLDFVWGKKLFDPVVGQADKVLSLWFLLAIISLLVGSLSSVREIVKEREIYKRERAINLKILPYVLSKVWVGIVVALYQSSVLLLFRAVLVQPKLPSPQAYFPLFITLFLGTVCGYLTGLAISAIAPNQNASTLMLIAVIVPQFVFAGVLMPLDQIPGSKYISLVTPVRWTYEAFVRVTGLGDSIGKDPCWNLPVEQRQQLTNEAKEACPCMGATLFTECNDFPGILSPDFYSPETKLALAQPEPMEPIKPTQIPSPTTLPSPTPLLTPTPLPTLTPFPTPANPMQFQAYMEQQSAQAAEYQQAFQDQFAEYMELSQDQGAAYSESLQEQGSDYAEASRQQGESYSSALEDYSEEIADWQENRQKAISGAESMLATIYDDYRTVFTGTVTKRWGVLLGNIGLLLAVTLFFQKRKDVV